MITYTYNRGNWESASILPEWTDDEEFSAYLERIGYNTYKLAIGTEYGSLIEIYESTDAQTFYANVSPHGSTVHTVFLPDFPSFMMFMRDFAPAFSSIGTNDHLRQAEEILEKLFLLYHGHSTTSICSQCDPEGVKQHAKRMKTTAGG